MGPKTRVIEQDFFQYPLREQINVKHALIGLADLIDWNRLSAAMSARFVSKKGRRPARRV
jgi:IS5 family transposase